MGSYIAVMIDRMMLGKVITLVMLATSPIDQKLALIGSVTDLIKSHINSFQMFLVDGIIGNVGLAIAIVNSQSLRACIYGNRTVSSLF